MRTRQAKFQDPELEAAIRKTQRKAEHFFGQIRLDLTALKSLDKVMASSLRYSYGGVVNHELTTENQLVLDNTWHIGCTGSMVNMQYGKWEEAEHVGTRTILPAFALESIIEIKSDESPTGEIK